MMKLIWLPLLVLGLTACNIVQVNSNKSAAPVPAGFYKTSDRGDNWNIRASLYSLGGENKTFAGINITRLVSDPSDSQTLYLGTETNGLLYTHNGGDGWFYSVPASGVVNDLAVDYNDKCNIYVALHNKVYKSTDCTRSWDLIHLTSLENEFFTSLAIDPFDSRILYLGSSLGSILWSQDAGYSWNLIDRLPSRIVKIIINPKKSNSLFIATANTGIFYSTDRLVSKENLLDRPVKTSSNPTQPLALKNLGNTASYLNLAFDYTQTNGLLYSNAYGIFRLLDDGNWEEIIILNKPSEERVTSIAVNPVNGQEIFFATDGAFYQTVNNGIDWTVKPLPQAGTPNHLLVDPANTNNLYLSFYQPRQ